MRQLMIFLLAMGLAGCQAQPAKPKTASSSSKVSQISSHKKTVKKVPLKARVADLIGHYFVNTDDHDQVLQFTASTSGYYLDVQTRQAGADFTSSQAGIFNAKLSVSDKTYTLIGTPQPNAKQSQLSFEKLSATKIQQLPDGPIYRRVENDDLSTLNQ